ncbi:glycosyltransferase [Bacillus sp. MRMR6]|uniref:glycosyltransferase n=1 Tax=Bacillus sp. MRMR6 TaxID=1928617 RepID=UPI001115294B|nr:glycosyltransferase family 2 protein [Bacillus sp. MRMR6]
MLKRVAVIILNWNRAEQTISLINNFLDVEKNINICFIVVDNNSNDSERNLLTNYSKKNNFIVLDEKDLNDSNYDTNQTKYTIVLNENYGYAKGNNFGLKLAKKLGYEYSLVSNNDIFIAKPLIESLIHQLKNDNRLALIGPKIIGMEGEQQGPYNMPTLFDQFWVPFFLPVFIIINKLLSNKISRLLEVKDERYPYRLMGCFMLFKSDVMDEVGYFDESTFLYAEELILSEKLLDRGYKTGYYPEVSVKHVHGFSTKDLGNRKKFNLNLNSDLYYFEKYRNYGPLKLLLVKMGRKANFYLWEPLIRKLKNSNS